VPAEVRRSELLSSILLPGAVEVMEAALTAWEGTASSASSTPLAAFGFQQRTARTGMPSRSDFPMLPLARLDWSSWARIPSEARVAALLKPGPRQVTTGQ
ncbi:unnamed protein product, partial [Polarella glacialis]